MDTAASGGRRRAGSSIGFAIPINQAKSIADQIRAGHASATIHLGTRAFLGIEMQPTSSGSGAVLSGVPANTPAKAAGLAGGDTIVSFDGKPVKTPAELTQLIGAHHPGDRVQIGWVDTSGRRHTATVKLIAGPAD
jgi:S1-C subfamily serine protease